MKKRLLPSLLLLSLTGQLSAQTGQSVNAQPVNNTIISLPIQLVEFDVKKCGADVCVSWTTASEFDSEYFNVQRSTDGIRFVTIGVVAAAGRSNALLNYDFLDQEPIPGLVYYRLKQTDDHGDHGYSILRTIGTPDNSGLSMDVFPNPSDGSVVNISLNNTAGQEVLVVVYDVTGKENYSKVIVPDGPDGDTVYAIDPERRLTAGIYMITATSQDRFINKRLVVR